MTKKVYVNISCDWEGNHIRTNNIHSMIKFTTKVKTPQTHFICPNYILKPNKINNLKIIKNLTENLPNQETALHIHAFRELVNESNVKKFISKQSLWCGEDNTGQTIPLSEYKKTDKKKIINTSYELLKKITGKDTNIFRGGGWIVDQEIREMLLKLNMNIECSPPPTSFFYEKQQYKCLYTKLYELWGTENFGKQPYKNTINDKEMFNYPNNLLFVDYLGYNNLMIQFLRIIENNLSSEKPLFISVGYHQETAYYYLNRLEKFINTLKDKNFCSEIGIDVVFANMETINNIFFQTGKTEI